MRFIYQFPEARGSGTDMLDVGPLPTIAAEVERAGWDGIAFTEHPAPGARWLSAGGHQTLDPFVALGAAAAVTSRISLLSYLCVLPYRNPLLLAKTAATLDRISGGRLVLGVGTGYLRGEFRALGVDFEQRNALFDEALEILPLAWSGAPFDFDGIQFTAHRTQALPAPGRDIPIWIGGNSARARDRVARLGHGWMPLGGSEELLATVRTPGLGAPEDMARLFAPLRDRARARGVDVDLVLPYPDADLTLDPAADPERHRERIGRLSELGVTQLVMLAPSGTEVAQTVEWIDTVAELYLGAR